MVQGTLATEAQLTMDRQLLMTYFRQYINEPQNEHVMQQAIDFQNSKQYNQLDSLIMSHKDSMEVKYNIQLDKDISQEKLKAYTTVGGTPHLDNEYTVFGIVVEGLDVLDKICAVETRPGDRPVTDVVIKKMYVEN
ncbi:MAG: peptidylprolyl isomerase [Bacteroidales bacterium]|nr:peptidylprolyl isomerase [Bacteroidales bacterium]